MRNYSAKADAYRLPKERTSVLRAFCLSARGDDVELIRDVAWDMVIVHGIVAGFRMQHYRTRRMREEKRDDEAGSTEI